MELFVWLRRRSLCREAQGTYAAHGPVIPSTGARQLPRLIHYTPVGDSIYILYQCSAPSASQLAWPSHLLARRVYFPSFVPLSRFYGQTCDRLNSRPVDG